MHDVVYETIKSKTCALFYNGSLYGLFDEYIPIQCKDPLFVEFWLRAEFCRLWLSRFALVHLEVGENCLYVAGGFSGSL